MSAKIKLNSNRKKILKPSDIGWSFKEISRNVHVIEINFDSDYKEQKILLQSDVHWDNPKTSRKLLLKHLNQAKNLNAPIIDAGDWFCAMQGKYDPRAVKADILPEHNNAQYLDSLIETSADFLEPYKDLLTVRGQGNHETSILKRHETNLTERLVERLKAKGSIAKLGGYSGWVRFLLRYPGGSQESFRLWYHHGWGGGGPVTRGTIQTARVAAYIDADICLTGHCFDSKTEILTPTGWKTYDSLLIGSEVMTLNRDTGKLEPNAVSAVHVYHDYNKLITINHKSVSLAVTDQHGLWLGRPTRVTKSGPRKEWQDCDWKALPAEIAAGKEWWIRSAGIEDNEKLPLNDDQVALLAWIIAEGNIASDNQQIRITQADGSDGRLELLEQNLKGSVKKFSKNSHKGGIHTKLKCYRYNICNNKQEWAWIGNYIDKNKTPLPSLYKLSLWQRKIFLDTYIMADGSVDKTPGSTGFQLASNRQDHINFLQALCVRTGFRTTTSYSKKGDMIYLHACEKESSYLQPSVWAEENYNGPVWCVTVPNSTLVVRRNGKTVITMNTHDAWIMPLERLKLNNNNRIVKYRQVHVRAPGYKEEYADGFGGWHIERGGPPKSLGAAWLTIKSEKTAFSFEVTEAT